jgi:hypothetical protein
MLQYMVPIDIFPGPGQIDHEKEGAFITEIT